MKTTGNTNNIGYLKQFAAKSNKNKSSVNIRSVIYNRCSSEKQDTLEQQDSECINLCQEYGLEIIKTYSEKESADTDDRTAFLEMLKFCEKESIGHIVVYNFDRFTRTGDVGLLKQLRDKGIRVHSVKQRVDDETSSGQFSQGIFVLFAKWENDQRRDRIMLGQRTKLRRGELIGSPTIGYEKRYVTGKKEHIHDKRQCFINEDGVKLRQAFYWKDLEKLRNCEIKARLEKMGLKISASELTRIFKNIFYIGYITSKMLDEGEIIRGKHEPLISEELFFRVNGIAKQNPHGWNVVRRDDEMPLKVSVHCDKCNHPLTGYSQRNGAYLYYKCRNHGCNVNIRSLKLHNMFAAELSKLTMPAALGPVINAQLEATYWLLHNSDAARIKPMKDELTRLKNELEQMELNVSRSTITPEIFEKFSGRHKQQIKDIEESIQYLLQDSSNLDKMLQSASKLSSNLLNIWNLSDYIGKVRLQKLVFPEGLRYNHENHELRTLKINPILSAITSISINNENINLGPSASDGENLRSLYSMFPSSNFFWESLEEINSQMSDFEGNCKNVSSSPIHYQHEATGYTQTIGFSTNNINYSSGLPDFNALPQDLYSSSNGSGSTNQRLYK